MAAEACKRIIDQLSQLIGDLNCLNGTVALNGAQGRSPSPESAAKFERRATRLQATIGEILDEVTE